MAAAADWRPTLPIVFQIDTQLCCGTPDQLRLISRLHIRYPAGTAQNLIGFRFAEQVPGCEGAETCSQRRLHRLKLFGLVPCCLRFRSTLLRAGMLSGRHFPGQHKGLRFGVNGIQPEG